MRRGYGLDVQYRHPQQRGRDLHAHAVEDFLVALAVLLQGAAQAARRQPEIRGGLIE